MTQELYKKGHRLVWIGFLGSVLFRILAYSADPKGSVFPNWASMIPVFTIFSLGFLVVLIYGCLRVLKAKGRHWGWIFLLLLNIIGLLAIFWLKDKVTGEAAIPTSPMQSSV